MYRPRAILAATDLSGAARNAVLRAGRIAGEIGAALHIIHVARPNTFGTLRTALAAAPQDVKQRAAKDAGVVLEELVERIARDCGVAASARIAHGPLLDEIEKAQQETGAGLTVLGARGSSVARHILLGSTAERLLLRAQHPMLVARLPATVPYRRALVGVDFSDASLPTLRRARELAPDAHIAVLHAYEAPFEGKLRYAGVDRDRMADYLYAAASAAHRKISAFVREAGGDGELEPVVVRGHPLACVLRYAESADCQLVAVGGGGHGRVAHFLTGDLSRRILVQSQTDVLLSVPASTPAPIGKGPHLRIVA